MTKLLTIPALILAANLAQAATIIEFGPGAANSINRHGEVVGGTLPSGGNPYVAFLYDGRTLNRIINLPSVANCINDLGQVAGYYTTSGNQTHAFMWANGVLTDITSGSFDTAALG